MYTYDLFNEVLNLRDVVDDFFKGAVIRERRTDYPYIAVYEGNDELEIAALVPGLKAEDLKLEIVDGSLIIEGEKKNDHTENPYIRKERLFGTFTKSVKLPYQVNQEAINATLVNGVLTVKLVKSENAKPKKIDIK